MTQRFFRDGAITAAALDAAETVARVEIEAIAGAFGPGAVARSLRLVRHRGGARRHPRAERILRRRHHAGRARPAAPPHARRRARLAPQAQRAQRRARAGAGGRPRDHDGGRRRAPGRAHRSRSAVRCASACSTISSGARSTRTRARRRSSASSSATASIARRRFASAISRRRSTAARVAAPDADAREAGRVGRAGCTRSGCRSRTTGFHKHGAYILQNADMPGFSAGEQSRLALLVFGCRGGLAKIGGALGDKAGPRGRARRCASRSSSITRARRSRCRGSRSKVARDIRFGISRRWLAAHPLTDYLLAKERAQWAELGHPWRVASPLTPRAGTTPRQRRTSRPRRASRWASGHARASARSRDELGARAPDRRVARRARRARARGRSGNRSRATAPAACTPRARRHARGARDHSPRASASSMPRRW